MGLFTSSSNQDLGRMWALVFSRQAMRTLWKNKMLLVAVVMSASVMTMAVAAPLIAPYDPFELRLAEKLTPPLTRGERSGVFYLFGSDTLGRDLLSRIIFGFRTSIGISGSAVVLALVVGAVLGLLAGYFGGIADSLIMRITDAQLSLPFIVLAIAILTVTKPTVPSLIAVLALGTWPTYARILRSVVLVEKESDFVLAGKALGAGGPHVIRRYIVPNVFPQLLPVATLDIATMAILEAVLSFVGMGIQPPTPSWGNIMADGRPYLATAWWIATLPGIAIVFTVVSINLLGRSLEEIINPGSRRLFGT